MKRLLVALRIFFRERFNLTQDMQEEHIIVENVKKEVIFKGTNVWTLVFAIFIASIGLNVNSTAVIIGAMLISPLMGPIIGVGLGIGINDIETVKKGILNLCIAAGVSVATSSIYFAITPLHEAQSELLARTTPTIWDVFIAFFGGLAGIVAGTRKEKSNVIPGVAIATALMPPLCTAGYGLATGQWFYFLGAFYLFFINSLFICLATFLVVKQLKFRRVKFASPEREKRISRIILVLAILTILPSVYLAYRLVQKSIFENNIKNFVQGEFKLGATQVAKYEYDFNATPRLIELLLVGQPLNGNTIDSLTRKLPQYDLEKTKLVVHQGPDASQMIEKSTFNSKALEELNARLNAFTTMYNKKVPVPIELRSELKALYPTITEYSLSENIIIQADTTLTDTVMLFTARFSERMRDDDMDKMRTWLKQRTGADSLKMIVE